VLVSSNVRRDPPDRFDLRLSWSPPQQLRPGLLQSLLGTPYGVSATWDDGWIVEGGILEYRSTAIDTPYLLFSSPAYVRDPLDLLEAADLPHLPSLASVSIELERDASRQVPKQVEDSGAESKRLYMPRGVSITVYSASGPQRADYLAGLAISLPGENGLPANAAEFLPALRSLGKPTPDQVVAAAFGSNPATGLTTDGDGYDSFAAYGNFALALSHTDSLETCLSIWRRIESPRPWCEYLRLDLERCSPTPH
jgi:hypothetical protein